MHAWLAKEAEGGRDQMECLVETLSRLIDIPSRTPKELGAPAAQLFATFVHASAPVLGFEEEEAFVLNLSL